MELVSPVYATLFGVRKKSEISALDLFKAFIGTHPPSPAPANEKNGLTLSVSKKFNAGC